MKTANHPPAMPTLKYLLLQFLCLFRKRTNKYMFFLKVYYFILHSMCGALGNHQAPCCLSALRKTKRSSPLVLSDPLDSFYLVILTVHKDDFLLCFFLLQFKEGDISAQTISNCINS